MIKNHIIKFDNMNNINTKGYWEKRFSSGSWNNAGKRQTEEYAKANINLMNISTDFNGKIIDFGCALGDAIPLYKKSFPNAKIIGLDISETAIEICKKRYGTIAQFYACDISTIPNADIIIASHVFEHITDDKKLVTELLTKCSQLFVFVPYMEFPLYVEHVNSYDENYYADIRTSDYKIFEVKYRSKIGFVQFLKNSLTLNFRVYTEFSKQIIMFHFKGFQKV
jgi:hypothetical protein